jgi:protein-tyrosine-phosphatase
MKLIGYGIPLVVIILALVNYTKEKEPQDAIPDSYQHSVEKAERVEQTLQDATQQRLRNLDDSGSH